MKHNSNTLAECQGITFSQHRSPLEKGYATGIKLVGTYMRRAVICESSLLLFFVRVDYERFVYLLVVPRSQRRTRACRLLVLRGYHPSSEPISSRCPYTPNRVALKTAHAMDRESACFLRVDNETTTALVNTRNETDMHMCVPACYCAIWVPQCARMGCGLSQSEPVLRSSSIQHEGLKELDNFKAKSLKLERQADELTEQLTLSNKVQHLRSTGTFIRCLICIYMFLSVCQ